MTPIKFLQLFHAGRTWVLTAIEPDGKGIETKAFPTGPKQEANAAAWVDKWNGKRNIYFSVAEVMRDEDKKAERENVAAVHWLHVDIDADGREDLVTELARIKKLVTTGLPDGAPKPTCVIYSGGGYQAFWKLDQPIPIQGDVSVADEAKRYNEQLEALFGGDSCANVDRIMRLPGTQNIPNARKVAKGRGQVEAKVVSFTKSKYALTKFAQAVEGGLDIPENVERLKTVDNLDQWGISDHLKVIIVQGLNVDKPRKDGKDNSRSSWLFEVVCGLLRAEVPDEVVYSVITDPGFKISESVLETSNKHKCALHHIENGKAAVAEPALAKMNEQYAVVKVGGKTLVLEQTYNHLLKEYGVQFMPFQAVRDYHCNESVMVPGANGNPRPVPLGKWWLEHPRRRQYASIAFAPEGAPEDVFNLWNGFKYKPSQGDAHESFLKHVFENICRERHEYFDYLMHWWAHMVQFPGRPGITFQVFHSEQTGTGKTFTVELISDLFGRHAKVADNARLASPFNSWMMDAVLIHGDEIDASGRSKDVEARLKMISTAQMMAYEAKGKDTIQGVNCSHLMVTSNQQHVVDIAKDDRRVVFYSVGDEHAQDRPYFARILGDWKKGGAPNLLWALQHDYNVEKFNPEDAPTDEKRTLEMIRSNRQDWTEYLWLLRGHLDCRKEKDDRFYVWVKDLAGDGSNEAWGATLGQLGRYARPRIDGEQNRGYWIPELHFMRAAWAELKRYPGLDWDAKSCWDTGTESGDLPF